MRVWAFMGAALALGASGGGAWAAPGLANKVYEPYVKNGVTEVELRSGRLTGGGASGESATVLELSHGFSDRLSLGVLAEFEDQPGVAARTDAVGLEAVAYLGQIPKLGVDVGAYLEYEQRLHNESGLLEAKLLFAKQADPVQGLFNLILEQPLTDRDGEGLMEVEYAAQATVDAGHKLKLGAQAFGDIGTTGAFGGRQEHYAGPIAKWETYPSWLPGELELEAAYLFPLGSARDETDGQVRFVIEYEHRF